MIGCACLSSPGSVVSSIPISAVIIVKNAEQTLRSTLTSLEGLPEVVIYDNGSEDQTLEIASSFSNVAVHTGEFLGFGPSKNHAAALAANDWVLSVDADEAVTSELMKNILSLDLSDPHVVYTIHRYNYFMGKHVRFSGWGKDWLPRLYHRNTTGFTEAMVHENILVPKESREIRLQGELRHDAVREIGDFLVKINRYSELRRRGRQKRRLSAPMIVLRSFWTFVHTYFLRRAFLDGWRGLVISVSNANGVFFKYVMPYADVRIAQEKSQREQSREDRSGEA